MLAWLEVLLGVAALLYAAWYYLNLDKTTVEGVEIGRYGAVGFAALGLAFLLAGLALRSHKPMKWIAQLLWLVPVFMIGSDLLRQ